MRQSSPSVVPTLSGVVYDVAPSGLRPLAGVGLDISVEYQSWPPRLATDDEGRYQFSGGASAPPYLKIRAEKDGYSQPCGVLVGKTDATTFDVYLVSNAVLSTTGVPALLPVRPPVITGTVSEAVANGGHHAVSGVAVVADFSGGMGWSPSATTVSDASGRFFLCGVESMLGIELYVTKPGYRAGSVGAGRQGGHFDVLLTRQ